jgi:hypothetical protein
MKPNPKTQISEISNIKKSMIAIVTMILIIMMMNKVVAFLDLIPFFSFHFSFLLLWIWLVV